MLVICEAQAGKQTADFPPLQLLDMGFTLAQGHDAQQVHAPGEGEGVFEDRLVSVSQGLPTGGCLAAGDGQGVTRTVVVLEPVLALAAAGKVGKDRTEGIEQRACNIACGFYVESLVEHMFLG